MSFYYVRILAQRYEYRQMFIRLGCGEKDGIDSGGGVGVVRSIVTESEEIRT